MRCRGSLMLVAIALGFLPLPCWASLAFVATTRQFQCGPMTLVAVTVSTPERDLYSSVLSQTLAFENQALRIRKLLDLQQHVSSQHASGGARMLDAPGWGWGCTYGRDGKPYLIILFACRNPNAKSCSLDIQSGYVEWNIIYDESGSALSRENRFFDDAYEQRLKKLGLWKAAFEQVDVVGELFWAVDDTLHPTMVRPVADDPGESRH